MSRKRKEKDATKDGEQYERFLQKAKEIGADDEKAFEDAVGKILKVKPKKNKEDDKNGDEEAPSA